MSNRRELVVERLYRPDELACIRALEQLLKTPVSKEDGPPTAPDSEGNATKEDSPDGGSIHCAT